MNIKNLKDIISSANNFNVKVIDIDFYNITDRRIFLGHKGDHNLYILRLIVPKEEAWNDSHSVILSFQNKNDNEARWINSSIIDGDSYYFLVNNLMTANAGEGFLQFHVFFPDIESNTKKIIAKSSKISYIIEESLSLEDSESEIPVTQLTIIEELISNYENVLNDFEEVKDTIFTINASIGNADGCALTLSRNFGISISAESVNHEYHMNASGGGEPKQGYEIRRYPVSAGQIISIYCSDSEAGCKWVFKSENTGTSATNVGNVHPNAGRWIVEVPENATYLFTSTFTGDTTSEVMIISPSINTENIADDAVTIEKLQSNIRTSISNADGCTLALSRNFGINASVESVNHEFHMRADGGGEPKVGYEIRRYPVSAGQIISIYCSDSEAGCKWVFKSENTGTPATNVGNVHPNAGRWIVEVPENATYLFTSTFTGDAESEVMIIPPPVVDNSLTVSGAAADAKTTGNKIANVNTEATAINNTIGQQFRGANLSTSSINQNFWLNAFGGGSAHDGFEILRYPVTPGATIFIRVSESEAPAKWVFKTTDSGVTTNIVGDIHLYGGEWAVTVPDTANYLFIARQTGDVNSYATTTNFGKGHIINPCVFIYLSGGKLQIECTSTARAILDNNVMNISGWSTSLDYNANSTDAVIMTSSGFVLKRADKTSWGDCIIAYCYGAAYTVVSVDRYVFANAIPIDNMRKRAGVPFFVNKKRIKQYGVLTNQNFTKITDFGYFYRFNDGAIGTEPLRYATPDGNSVRNTNTLTANSANIANKTLLCIGDSITRRGWFQDQLKTRVSSLSFVGTQTTYFGELGNIDGKYKCEGYSGRTAKNVLVDSTILLQDGTTTIPNPFYNPSTQSIDYGYYCSQQGVAPDYVIIEFGLNEDQPKQYSTAIQGFINSVKSYAPNTVVYVIQPFNGVNSDIGSANSNSEQHEIQCELCVLESRSFTDCVLIPCWYIMVDELDYVLKETPYGYDDKTVTQFEDGVHPGLQNRGTTGFKKLGDQIYNYLGITS